MPGSLNAAHRQCLLQVARSSIRRGLQGGDALQPDTAAYDPPLQAWRAAFTTLTLQGQLRGCIGTTEAVAPLVAAVAHSAHSAAFQDPRFKPLTETEFHCVQLSLSLLTAPQPLAFGSDAELLQQVVPGVHGLTIAGLGRKSTFLPSVWEQLESPAQFLRQLKRKAGLPDDAILSEAWVYTAEYLSDG